MKVLITGASGLLGKALLKILPYQLVPCSSSVQAHNKNGFTNWEIFDITNRQATVAAIKKHHPDLIIHCAAIGSVDKVQVDFTSGLAVNLNGTINVIDGAREVNSKLVMVSTNAVFDGQNPLYAEDMHLCPISNYGIIKAAAELAVRASGLDWIVVRPILMYGNNNPWQRGNWVTIWLDKWKKGEACKVVNDVITQPLYNFDCAEVIKKAVEQDRWGHVFNVGGGDRLTLLNFAQVVAAVYGCSINLIEPVSSSFFPNIAPRPKDTSFDLAKVKAVLNHTPCGIYDGLIAMRTEDSQC